MIIIVRYEILIRKELESWKRRMRRRPSLINKASKGVQDKLNDILPEKYHETLTFAIKNMVKLVLAGSQYMTNKTYPNMTLGERERLVKEKIKSYKRLAMIEGAGTGAGGFLMGLADYSKILPVSMNQFDWRTFQQEYRDYIDLAKLAQMLPGVGAVVGFYTNGKLIDKLGETAMNSYRMRILK